MIPHFLIFLINLVVIQSRTEVEKLAYSPENRTHFDIYANDLSKAHYNAWSCTYRLEPGYKCLSCTAALHCYPSDFALLVQCAGFFPYCRNGYCSRWKTDGCNEDYMFAESTHGPMKMTTPANDVITTMAEENSPIESVQLVSDNNTSTTIPIAEVTDSSKVEILTSTGRTDE